MSSTKALNGSALKITIALTGFATALAVIPAGAGNGSARAADRSPGRGAGVTTAGATAARRIAVRLAGVPAGRDGVFAGPTGSRATTVTRAATGAPPTTGIHATAGTCATTGIHAATGTCLTGAGTVRVGGAAGAAGAAGAHLSPVHGAAGHGAAGGVPDGRTHAGPAGAGPGAAAGVTLAAYTASHGAGPKRTAWWMLIRRFHWKRWQFKYLDRLWSLESGWNRYASNPYSGAYGIPQAVPGSKMASAGPDWRSSARTQILWGLRYIQDRYRTPYWAWSHERAYGWY